MSTKGQQPDAGSAEDQDTGAPSPVVPALAAEDNPRSWGDEPDDHDAWLREQRPPHWG